MEIQQKTVAGGITVLQPQGRIVLGSEGMAVRKALEDLLKSGQNKVVVDMSGVDYLDSAGIGIIVSAMSKSKESGGDFRLAATTESVVRVFRVTNVIQLLSLDESVEASVAAIGGG